MHLKEGFRSQSAGILKISPLANYQDQQQLLREAEKPARKHNKRRCVALHILTIAVAVINTLA